MSTRVTSSRYSIGEEIANSITHGVGLVLATAALAILTGFASVFGNAWHIVSCGIFGITLIFLYTASTLYHSIQLPRAKTVLRVVDHSAIFFLIAGTYTPFTLVNLRGPWGWSLFGLIWGLAIAGVLLEIFFPRRWPKISVGLYVGMGWAVVIAMKPLVSALAPGGLLLLVAGGLAYTSGIAFYLWHGLPYHHAVWHLFVLAGSTLHFFAVLFYVIPMT